MHSGDYLRKELSLAGQRVVIGGGGQSGAEIFLNIAGARDQMRVRELLDRLRVCTGPGQSGCVVDLESGTYQVELKLQAVPKGFVPRPPGKSE